MAEYDHEDGSPRMITITRGDGIGVTLSEKLLREVASGAQPMRMLSEQTQRVIVAEWLDAIAGPDQPTG